MSADSDFFYEREAEYFAFTPFQFLDAVGEIVVRAVFAMFDRVGPAALAPHTPSLTRSQLEAVRLCAPCAQRVQGLSQWSALVESRFGSNYESFESYVIKNVLVIPDAFVLPHHREGRTSFVSAAGAHEIGEGGSLDDQIARAFERLQLVRRDGRVSERVGTRHGRTA